MVIGFNNTYAEPYLKLQTQLSCTKYETMSEPIHNGKGEELRGLVFNKNHAPATTATFKNCKLSDGYVNGMHFVDCDLSGVSFENAIFQLAMVRKPFLKIAL